MKSVDDYPWNKRRKGERLRIGHLGFVNHAEAKAHEDAGIMKHAWKWVTGTVGWGGYRCEICGRHK